MCGGGPPNVPIPELFDFQVHFPCLQDRNRLHPALIECGDRSPAAEFLPRRGTNGRPDHVDYRSVIRHAFAVFVAKGRQIGHVV
jgi:hypothetical protein